MALELDPQLEALLNPLAPRRGRRAEQLCCKICNAPVERLRAHLLEVHQMTAAQYRGLGAGYSLLPPSYGLRKARYLRSRASGE